MSAVQQDVPEQETTTLTARTWHITGWNVAAAWTATTLGVIAESLWPAEDPHSRVWELSTLTAAIAISVGALIAWALYAELRRNSDVIEFAQEVGFAAGYRAHAAETVEEVLDNLVNLPTPRSATWHPLGSTDPRGHH